MNEKDKAAELLIKLAEHDDIPITRKRFLRITGAGLAYFAFLGTFGADEVFAVTCGANNEDANCSTTQQDKNCGMHTQSGDRDMDQNCKDSQARRDQNCGKRFEDGSKDVDEHCGHSMPNYAPTDQDDNCGQTGGHGQIVNDENCGSGNSDARCGTKQPEYIGQRDNNCGIQLESGGYDEDSNCGYKFTDGTIEEDENCGNTKPDGKEDKDGRCGKVAGDADETCGAVQPDGKILKDEGCTPAGGPDVTDPGTKKQSNIGTQGGELSSDDDALKWSIPSGALAGTTTVTVVRWASGVYDLAPPPGNRTLVGDFYELEPSGEIYQSGQSATVTFTYPSGSNPERLGIYRLDDYSGEWQELPYGNIDVNARTISASTDHNSDYGLFEEPTPVPATSPWMLLALGGSGFAVLLWRYFARELLGIEDV